MSSELPAARVDLPTTPRDREVVWSSIRDAYSRHAQPGSSLAIVPYRRPRDGDRREDAVDVTYRRSRSASRPGRLLAGLVRRSPTMPPIGVRIDFVSTEPVEVTQA